MNTDKSQERYTRAGSWEGTHATGGFIPGGLLFTFRYPSGGTLGLGSGQPSNPEYFDKLSVNLVGVTPMDPDEIAIKNYSENEGVLAALQKAGIVTDPHRWVPSGWVMIPIVRLAEVAPA